MKKVILLGLFAAGSTLLADEVSFTVDAIHQRWPWETKIDVDFTITGESGKTYDANPSFFDGSNELEVPSGALSGDLWSLSPGSSYRLTLDPSKTAYTNQVFTRFSVSFSRAVEVPLYMIVDLTKAKGEEGLVTYLTKTQIKSGDYGSYEEGAWSGVSSSFIWTGVTNDAAYAKTKMVLRRIDPGTFTMGYGGARGGTTTIYPGSASDTGDVVRLTKPYYIAVFQTTQKQWGQLKDSVNCNFKGDCRPVERIGTDTSSGWILLRGTDAADGGFCWPSNGYAKASSSWLGILEDKLGLTCDLPTEAQWEYACRAGTTTTYNDGIARSFSRNSDSDFTDIQDEIGLLGRFSSNGSETMNVGSCRANAWGLYDMHGNVLEACLNWQGGTRYGRLVVNPAGPASGSTHICKGGAYVYSIAYATSGFRWRWTRAPYCGFRVVVFPPGVTPEVGEVYSVDAE